MTATALALLALSGTAYAVTQLPADSVGTRQLKDRAVTLAKIADGARDALHGARGARGPVGATGPAGPSEIRVSNRAAAPTTFVHDEYVTVSHIAVGAGVWEVSGQAILSGPDNGSMQCSLSAPGVVYTSFPYSDEVFPPAGRLNPTLSTVFQVNHARVVRMDCRLQGGADGSSWTATDIQLIARRAGSASAITLR